MKKNTILFVIDIYPPYSNRGGEISTQMLVEALAADGNKCIVLTSRVIQNTQHKSNNIILIPKLIIPFLPEEGRSSYFSRLIKHFFNSFWNFYYVLYAAFKYKVDIIHIVPLFYYSLVCVIASLFVNHNTIIDIHGWILIPEHRKQYEVDEIKSSSLYKKICDMYDKVLFFAYRNLIKILVKLRNKVHIVTPSNYMKNLLKAFNYPENKISVIYNINPLSKLSATITSRKNGIVFAGRLTNQKGIWDVIKGFQLLKNNKLTLHIIGTGTEKDPVQNFIKKNKIKNIIMHGKQDLEKVIQFYLHNKIIVAPSRAPESFGRFIQESALTATPLITTAVGAIPEIISNKTNGIIVDIESPHQIAEAINSLLHDKALYKSISVNISNLNKHFGSQTIVRKRNNLYQKLKEE